MSQPRCDCSAPRAGRGARAWGLMAEAEQAWERASKASVRTFELLHQLSDELASIPAANHLLPMLAELEDSIADEGGAVSEAARLLDAAATGRGRA